MCLKVTNKVLKKKPIDFWYQRTQKFLAAINFKMYLITLRIYVKVTLAGSDDIH